MSFLMPSARSGGATDSYAQPKYRQPDDPRRLDPSPDGFAARSAPFWFRSRGPQDDRGPLDDAMKMARGETVSESDPRPIDPTGDGVVSRAAPSLYRDPYPGEYIMDEGGMAVPAAGASSTGARLFQAQNRGSIFNSNAGSARVVNTAR